VAGRRRVPVLHAEGHRPNGRIKQVPLVGVVAGDAQTHTPNVAHGQVEVLLVHFDYAFTQRGNGCRQSGDLVHRLLVKRYVSCDRAGHAACVLLNSLLQADQ
jgi:hypothetical protein